MGIEVGRIDVEPLGRCIFAPDQRRGQPVFVVDVVKAKAPLDAQPLLVGRTVDTVDPRNLVVLDLERKLATDPAVGADRLDLAVIILAVADFIRADRLGGHERTGGAGLNTLAAGDTGRGTHGVVKVEGDLAVVAPTGQADDVVDLHFAAGTDTEVALDAGVEVDAHGDMTVVEQGNPRFLKCRKAAFFDPLSFGHVPQMRRLVVGDVALGLVGHQQLHDHLAGLVGALGGSADHHAFAGFTDAGRGQRALAVDLDHAGAAVAVGAVARLVGVAQVRDGRAFALGHLPDGFAGQGGDVLAVEGEGDGFDRVSVGHGLRPRQRSV